MESTNDMRQPRGASKHGPGKTPPDHHWVKALVPIALHHRLRAYAGLSEMTLPAFILATLANAVPLPAPANTEGPPPANAPSRATGLATATPTREGGSHA